MNASVKSIGAFCLAVSFACIAFNATTAIFLLPFVILGILNLGTVMVGLLGVALGLYASVFSFRWTLKYFSKL